MTAAALWSVPKIRRRQRPHEEDYTHTLIVPRRRVRTLPQKSLGGFFSVPLCLCGQEISLQEPTTETQRHREISSQPTFKAKPRLRGASARRGELSAETARRRWRHQHHAIRV